MKIVKGSEPIAVEHPSILIFGQPGICKTSLAYSAADPLLLDFDNGAHRAVNRRDTVQIGSWSDVANLANDPALAGYKTIIPDTVGRLLDKLTTAIIAETPKLGPNGNLSQQGWGTLKTRFRLWSEGLKASGKDILYIAHDKEDKDGDTRVVRPDITGGSYGEVIKSADFVGYLYMAGRDRVLDFSPTDRWIGKNPAGWPPFRVPPAAAATSFMADLFDRAREALGKISEASAGVLREVQAWRETFTGYTTAEQFNGVIAQIKALSPTLTPQVGRLAIEVAELKGVKFNKTTKTFWQPQPDPVALPAAVPPVEAPSLEDVFGHAN